MVICFIDGVNRSIQGEFLICKTRTYSMQKVASTTSCHERESNSQMLAVVDTGFTG